MEHIFAHFFEMSNNILFGRSKHASDKYPIVRTVNTTDLLITISDFIGHIDVIFIESSYALLYINNK